MKVIPKSMMGFKTVFRPAEMSTVERVLMKVRPGVWVPVKFG